MEGLGIITKMVSLSSLRMTLTKRYSAALNGSRAFRGRLRLWQPFDTVEIDGCSVSRASLHNLSFIRDLELSPAADTRFQEEHDNPAY